MNTTKQQKRAERTREQIRVAAQRLFLQHGFVGTSTDAIMTAAGIASKETLYRHYPSKEDLFVDVVRHLTLRPAAALAHLPPPQDLPSLRQALVTVTRQFLSILIQPEYLALLRITIAESARFPQLGALFRTSVPERGLTLLTGLLHQAQEHQVIAEVDYDAVTHMLQGGLLAYAMLDVLLADEGKAHPPSLDRADAIVEIMMRALTPR